MGAAGTSLREADAHGPERATRPVLVDGKGTRRALHTLVHQRAAAADPERLPAVAGFRAVAATPPTESWTGNPEAMGASPVCTALRTSASGWTCRSTGPDTGVNAARSHRPGPKSASALAPGVGLGEEPPRATTAASGAVSRPRPRREPACAGCRGPRSDTP